MPTAPVLRLANDGCKPVNSHMRALSMDVRLKASTAFAAGALLGEQSYRAGYYDVYDGSLIASGVAATLSQGAAGDLGTGTHHLVYTFVDSLGGESLPSPDASVILAALHRLHVSALGAIPTGAVGVNWYLSDAPNSLILRLIASNTGEAMDLDAYPTGSQPIPPTTGSAFVYDDGRQVPRCVLEVGCFTDAEGGIFLGTPLVSYESQFPVNTVPAWFSGAFRTTDVPNLDARAIGLLGRLLTGSLSDGLFVITGP